MSNAHPHIWTAIPAYNHAGTLRAVVEGALRQPPRVVVVDDGSTDADVAALLAGTGATVLTHPRNLGKGAALRTAARHIAGQGGEFMITLDADGQHDPADIGKFLPQLAPGANCLVVGERIFDSDTVPGLSRFGRRFSNFWVRRETGQAVADSQSGFRAYPVRLLLDTPCRSEGFAYETEILVRGCWAGLRLVQVPVSVHYPARERRISHFHGWRDNWALTRLHSRLIGQRLGGHHGRKPVVLMAVAGLLGMLLCACGKPATPAAGAIAQAVGPGRVNASWPTFRGDQALSGVAAADLPVALAPAWNFATGDQVKSSPVIADGRVFIGSGDGHLYALRLADGGKLWQYAAGAPIEAPPLSVGDVVCVGDGNGVMHAVDAAGGGLRWRFDAGQNIAGAANFAISPEGRKLVLFGSYDRFLYALDAATGQEVWKFAAGNFINGAPAVADGAAVFGGCDAFLRRLRLADGGQAEAIELAAYLPSSPAVCGGRAYVGHYEDALACVDLAASRVLWEFRDEQRPAPFFAPPAATPEAVVVGARNGRVYRLDPDDGRQRWFFQAQGDVDAGPVIAGDKVVVASRDGRLYLLRLADGKELWSAEIGSPIGSSPAVAGGMVVFGADDGRVYAFTGKE